MKKRLVNCGMTLFWLLQGYPAWTSQCDAEVQFQRKLKEREAVIYNEGTRESDLNLYETVCLEVFSNSKNSEDHRLHTSFRIN